MASIRDELRTFLAIDGLSAYLSALRQAQDNNLKAALTVADLHDKLRGIAKPIIQVGEALGLQAGQWALVATAIYAARSAINQIRQVVRESMEDFEKYNTVLFRTSFIFSSMGGSPGTNALRSFARERAATTGIAEGDTLSLLGRARQFGFSAQTAGRLVPRLQDVGASGLMSPESALDMINQLMHTEGRGRGSLGAISGVATRLGLDPRGFTGGQQHDLELILRQLTAKVGGLSDQMGQTVSGTFTRNQELLHQSMNRLGAIFESTLAPLIETLNRTLLGAIRIFDMAANRDSGLGHFIRAAEHATRGIPPSLGPEFWLINRILRGFTRLQDQGGLGQRDRNANHDSGKLDEIAANTLNMPSAIALAIFGSQSAFTRQAGSFRNFQAAINART
jgi:hypothetical protein